MTWLASRLIGALYRLDASLSSSCIKIFMYLGVVYSGENDVRGVTVSLNPHRGSSKICLTTVGIEPTTFRAFKSCILVKCDYDFYSSWFIFSLMYLLTKIHGNHD